MPKILHLGIGNFHRAHQAWYVHQANLLSGSDWKITGVSLRSPNIRNQLAPQAYQYMLAIKDKDAVQYEKMSVHDDILVARENSGAILDMIADPETKIITLTITEKGYYLDANSGELDLNSPFIQDEIASQKPKSALGFLAHGLMLRKQQNGEPINIISCDNLPENGTKLRNALTVFAKKSKLDIAKFLNDNCTIPNTMIDRIVPATTDELREEVNIHTEFKDAHPVSTEKFSEWYIEDILVGETPAWRDVGVSFVNDVAPYELRKLRLLNGSHSLIAYKGLLAGHEFVHEAVADSQVRASVEGFMKEAMQTLPDESRQGAEEYCEALFERFENPNLNHKLLQIAMDGSLKLPIRILPVIEALDNSAPYAQEALQCWAKFIVRKLRAGDAIDDPANDRLNALEENNRDDKQLEKRLITLVSA